MTKPEDLDLEQRRKIVRLFEEYKPGERVRAVCGIEYAASGRSVAEGADGIIRETAVGGCTPLVRVEWLGATVPPIVETTSAEHLEPVDREATYASLLGDPPEFRKRDAPPEDIHERRRRFVTLCAFDLPHIREDVAGVLGAWSECLDDLTTIGVIRSDGHRMPDGLVKMQALAPRLRVAVGLLEVMIRKLRELEGA